MSAHGEPWTICKEGDHNPDELWCFYNNVDIGAANGREPEIVSIGISAYKNGKEEEPEKAFVAKLARRIVACVNLCANLTDEQISDILAHRAELFIVPQPGLKSKPHVVFKQEQP